jgi:tungstate transport system ATP-binding protein
MSLLPLSISSIEYSVRNERLLRCMSFEIREGGPTVLLGANGAGKSLTLRICHGLLKPTAGEVTWSGPPSKKRAKARQAMVFQRPVLLRGSALANVTYALAIRGVARRERKERALKALARVGLDAIAHRSARALSAGEQQRLALARAWSLEPQVLFLDEPTASLDPSATLAVEEVIRAIHEAGTKIVMTTHNLPQARRFAEDVLFLHDGRLLEWTRADEFFERPSTKEARAFLKGELSW